MKPLEYQQWQTKAINGEIADDNNPAFIFSLTSTELLTQIAQGKINAKELAKRTLESRGQDINGNWVGFDHRIK